jgi:hypothetical protein
MMSRSTFQVDGAGQGVGAERAGDLGEPLLDGHPPGVLADEVAGGGVAVVGDDHGRGVVAEAGDDELADGAGVGGERGGGVFVHPGVGGLAAVAGPVQGDGLEIAGLEAGDVAGQGG